MGGKMKKQCRNYTRTIFLKLYEPLLLRSKQYKNKIDASPLPDALQYLSDYESEK